jgi:3-oxoacyl-[acyl-carrier protein] reductase
VLAARNAENLKETAAEVKALGAEPYAFAGDLSEPDTAVRLVHEVAEQYGRIEALLKIAGVVPQIDLFEITANGVFGENAI